MGHERMAEKEELNLRVISVYSRARPEPVDSYHMSPANSAKHLQFAKWAVVAGISVTTAVVCVENSAQSVQLQRTVPLQHQYIESNFTPHTKTNHFMAIQTREPSFPFS